MKKLAEIIGRKLQKRVSEDDEKVYRSWEKRSANNRTFFELLSNYWNTPAHISEAQNKREMRDRLENRISMQNKAVEKRELYQSWKVYVAAAVLVGVIILSSVYATMYTIKNNQSANFQVSTEAGQRTQMTLPDGSKVWLNAATHLSYSETAEARHVNLDGEAYFEVQHASDHPFEVETGNGKIHVVGTKFVVSHYKGSVVTETSLLEGKIMFEFPGDGKQIEITPGKRMVFDSSKRTYWQREYNIEEKLMWREGVLIFKKEPFNQLIEKLERYYAVSIEYPENEFFDAHYTGTIDNLRLENLMEFIALTIPMKYKIKNREVIIYKK